MSAPLMRREFVRRLPAVGACLGAAALGASGCAGVAYLAPRSVDGTLAVPLASVRGTGGVFVQVPGGDRPLFVHEADDGELVAVLARCTHRGCQPEPVAARLVCPCHGSEYDFAGNLLEGPAERPLDRYRVTTQGEEARIWIPGGGS